MRLDHRVDIITQCAEPRGKSQIITRHLVEHHRDVDIAVFPRLSGGVRAKEHHQPYRKFPCYDFGIFPYSLDS